MLLYLFLIISSICILKYKHWKKDDSIRIEWEQVAKFLGVMALLTMLRFCLADIWMQLVPESIIDYISRARSTSDIGSLAFVFWEDVWFGMSIAWIMSYLYPVRKRTAIAMVVLISLLFGSGHLYQGWIGMILSVYPFFISYKYGKKYGFGTVMVCHMLYDFITVMTVKNIHLIM